MYYTYKTKKEKKYSGKTYGNIINNVMKQERINYDNSSRCYYYALCEYMVGKTKCVRKTNIGTFQPKYKRGNIKMQSKSIEKNIQISRIIITLMVFIVLNSWFIFENDPHWMLATIMSIIVFFFSFLSSKICKFLINKGDKIKNKLLKGLYYAFALPIVFLLLLLIIVLFLLIIFEDMELSFGAGLLLVFTGIEIFICVLVPYFQTLIILILRYFLN